MHLNGFMQCSPCPQSKGQWKNPRDGSILLREAGESPPLDLTATAE
jgi:hypothetical protein